MDVNESRQKTEKRVAKNFRLPTNTINAIEELSTSFGESQADVVVRAISLLKENQQLALDKEYTQRLSRIKADDSNAQ